jgi:hypothetical protein
MEREHESKRSGGGAKAREALGSVSLGSLYLYGSIDPTRMAKSANTTQASEYPAGKKWRLDIINLKVI